ncbi:MAG: SDR family oxidoreductase [Edaphobacter sp.]|uniref:SDR family NAD(P)-dependent oxidoreductase n=1 Tax=Edaphobacter sp. TaxID=1934404 RepID=UPI002392B324|nr:SDR family oxidoreductase [Edaphobacter sp.]MDE1177301.1 SDR family oxidoreductase [Edaphobacter sp.]
MHTKKNALIFGGSSGIGLATVEALHACDVAITIADVKEPLHALGNHVQYVACDVCVPTEIEEAVAAATADAPLDWLVYSAGIQRYGSVVTTPLEEYDLVQKINTRGAFLACKSAIPAMVRGGSIVLVSSVQAIACQAGVAAYAASKGALESLMRAMAIDHAEDGIRINSVLPGTVDTPMVRSSVERFRGDTPSEHLLEQWGSNHPVGRVARPGEIANVITFLLREESSFLTGASYRVDGGLLAQLPVRL